MRAIALILAIGLVPAAAAGDRHLPIDRCCKSVTSFDLVETEAVDADWVRADVREVLVSGSESGSIHVWFANCTDPRVVKVRNEIRPANLLAAGEVKQVKMYGLRDPDMKTTAKAICERHVAGQKTEGTK